MYRFMKYLIAICCIALYGVTAANASSTKSCLAEDAPLKSKGECLQEVLEYFYSPSMTRLCPNFGLNLAAWECAGCPWDNIDNEMARSLNETTKSKLMNASRDADTCEIARFVDSRKYDVQSIQEKSSFQFSFLGIFIATIVNIYIVLPDNEQRPKTPTILGIKIPEYIFMLLLSVAFCVATGFNSRAYTFYTICEAPQARDALKIANLTNVSVFLIGSLWRCIHLSAGEDNVKEKFRRSWYEYYSNKCMHSRWKRSLAWFLCYGGPFAVFLTYAAELVLPFRGLKRNLGFYCDLGKQDFTSYSILVYQTLVFQSLTVTIYSCRPSTSQIFFYARYSFLLLALLVSPVIILLHAADFDVVSPIILNMAILGVPDVRFDSGLAGGVSTIFLALLGLLEPIRIGWPKDGKFSACEDKFEQDKTDDTLKV